jgi:hypothetical protein
VDIHSNRTFFTHISHRENFSSGFWQDGIFYKTILYGVVKPFFKEQFMDEKLFFVKKRKGNYSLFALLLAAVFVFVSCDNFFSTSWGTPRDYDSDKIDVNAGNVDRWIKESAGNPALAHAIADKINKELANAGGGPLTEEQLTLQHAGVKLAIEASGLGEAILGSAADAISKLSDIDDLEEEEIKDTVMDLLGNIQNEFKPEAAENLAKIAGYSVVEDGGRRQFSTGYAESAKPGDVGLAIVTLAMAIIDEKTLDVADVDLDKLDDKDIPISVGEDGKVSITADDDSEVTPEIIALAAYLNLISSDTSGKYDDNPITSALRDAFGLN